MADAVLKLAGAWFATKEARRQLPEQVRASDEQAMREYREVDRQQEEAGEAAAQAKTDRMREAARRLSMARVLAAHGHGSLEARAKNIAASEGEDLQRIETSRRKAITALQHEREAVRLRHYERMRQIINQARMARANALMGVVSAGVSAYGDYYRRSTQTNSTYNSTDSNR